jgi:hypothetical protein
MLVTIGQDAFAGWTSLRSFTVPKSIETIGKNCFKQCPSLFRLKFRSGRTLKRIVGETRLDDALDHLRLTEISSLFRIEVEEDGGDLAFPGWIPVADESSHLTLARYFS